MNRAASLHRASTTATSGRLVGGEAFSRRALTRFLYVALIVLFATISVFAYRAAEQKRRDAIAANDAAAWRQSGAVAATNPTLDAFIAAWGAQRATNSGQTTLTWSTRDTRDLRASLLALDATKANVQRIDVTRREAGFTLVAEVLQ